MRISDWSSDVCSSDLGRALGGITTAPVVRATADAESSLQSTSVAVSPSTCTCPGLSCGSPRPSSPCPANCAIDHGRSSSGSPGMTSPGSHDCVPLWKATKQAQGYKLAQPPPYH